MLKIDPVESWTRTDFEGSPWDWVREDCSNEDFDSFKSHLSDAGPRKFVNLMRFYMHCSTHLDFCVSDEDVPSGLRGIEPSVCNFMRRVLMDEDIGRRTFEWIMRSNTVSCHEIFYNPNIPIDLLMSINRSFTMSFQDEIFRDHWERFPFRFEREKDSLPECKIPVVRGLLVRGPEMAMAMRDEDHSALIDAMERCETWEEYEMMCFVSSSSSIRLRNRDPLFLREIPLSSDYERIVGSSVLFYDSYHLAKAGRHPSCISHLSPSKATLTDHPTKDGCKIDLADFVHFSAQHDDISVRDFIDGPLDGMWESVSSVLRDDILFNYGEVGIDDIRWIMNDHRAPYGIGFLMFVESLSASVMRAIAISVAEMKRTNRWDEWSSGLRLKMPDMAEMIGKNHYDVESLSKIVSRFGPIGSIVDINDFVSFIFNIDAPDSIKMYHGTSDHRFHEGFPGTIFPPIIEVGIVPPQKMGTQDYESRKDCLDVVFMTSSPSLASNYAYKSVCQDDELGVKSSPILLEIDIDRDSSIEKLLLSGMFSYPTRESVTLAEAICCIPLSSPEGVGENGLSEIILTKETIPPSMISREIFIPEREHFDEGAIRNRVQESLVSFKLPMLQKG